MIYLRPKAYILDLFNPDSKEQTEKKRVKGVKHRLIAKLTREDFEKALKNETIMVEYFSFIRDRLEIYNAKHRKVALRAGCQKRKFLSSGNGSLAWGNVIIRDQWKPFIDENQPADFFDFLENEIYFIQ